MLIKTHLSLSDTRVASASNNQPSASGDPVSLEVKRVKHTSKPAISIPKKPIGNKDNRTKKREPLPPRAPAREGAAAHAVKSSSSPRLQAVSGRSGIVPAHLLPLQKVAADTQQIIAFRHVDRMSTGLIESGHPTKGFLIKGKSANHGPQAGFICVNQALSKLHKSKPKANTGDPQAFYAKVNKYNKSVTECLNNGAAKAVALSISQARLDFLKQENVVSFSSVSERFELASQGLNYVATKNQNGRYDISINGEPLKVLADPASGKPLTADYDLMFIAPKTEQLDLEKDDNLPVKRIHFDSVSETYKKNFARTTGKAFTPQAFFQKEEQTKGSQGQDIGNATPRIAKMIDVINQQLVGEGFPVVHHNADSGSPATDPSANYPITIFMPEEFGGYERIHVIENAEGLADFIQQAKDKGFSVPINPKWEPNVASVRSQAFTQAIKTFQGD
ncbi:anthrax toxin-like adenylyl cyclase domain-containing protein [Vibrio ostreicida]|uniref:Anthrax toxin-like adenylyl cyclase domain-containing protein n=1 Tax=Vibrio ostreicida TaxID=526588 RepID=A0ABT8BUT8_9VIBR|nr:anthrax toxin-like adenylyl cyclase domain-containing protein [Vibrio ostreicida]MDN3610423.1 anthrax toxin-like adenylyl cyclase domain-containing protein [Vibrio ostreicida]NPD07568.1 adenylate cyclase [Vibrio ostreicida]